MTLPARALAALLIGLALLVTGYFRGRHDANQAAEVRIGKMVADAEAARQAEATAAFRRAEKLEVEDAKAKVVYRTITETVDRIVDRPVYRAGMCFDDDGVRAANAALAGTLAPAAEPDRTVPGTVPAR